MLLSGHAGDVTSAVFSPDGSQLITASADRTVRRWKQVGLQPAEQFRERVRSATSACLTPGQRQRQLGERVTEARTAHAACERRYGREPARDEAPEPPDAELSAPPRKESPPEP